MIKIGKNISGFSTHSYKPTSKDELSSIIKSRIKKHGSECDLNDIDTSLITDMSGLLFSNDFS